jgi:hypothetical protein
VLWHRVLIDVADAPAARALAVIAQQAQPAFPAEVDLPITVSGSVASGYRVLDHGDLLAEGLDRGALLDCVFPRVYRRALELAALKGWSRFHGATVGFAGRRLALVGPSGAGKTTLAIGLLARGGTVEGDESFLTDGADVVAVTRRFHVKPESLPVLPEAPWLAAVPPTSPENLRMVDPTEHGLPWVLRSGPLDHLVLVRPTDGASSIEPAVATAAVQELIGQAFPLVEARRDIVSRASGLASSAPVHVLYRGHDARAADLLATLVRANREA